MPVPRMALLNNARVSRPVKPSKTPSSSASMPFTDRFISVIPLLFNPANASAGTLFNAGNS